MAVLKCNVCGGELELNSDMSVGTCLFCNSVISIPKELDRKGHLYNRAVFLRQNNEFDKAELVYEDLLKEDNEDADAHWGLILSKFGIEYVKDPATGEYFPTCHRTQTEPILSDPDYLAAMQCADEGTRQIIQREAKKIAEIQRRVLEISAKEPPYDVFICYKESDAAGNRTQDSVLAQELYFELCKRNYRVFFARKTLESKLGTEYEPIIYAALNSSKVMVVLGTCAEHFNAVWVKNEWSRFLKMSAKKRGEKVIIPTYRGMSPYELPSELSNLQAQDMSKIGFMQDLTDGIERVLHRKTVVNEEDLHERKQKSSIEDDLQRAETFLRLNNYEAALKVYKSLTEKHPEDYRGWWGVFVAKTENMTKYMDVKEDKTMHYVKTLASEEAYQKCEADFVKWLENVVAPHCITMEKNELLAKTAKLEKVGLPYQSIAKAYQVRGSCNEKSYKEDQLDNEKKLGAAKNVLSSIAELKSVFEKARDHASSKRGFNIFMLVVGIITAVVCLGVCVANLSDSAFIKYGVIIVIALGVAIVNLFSASFRATDYEGCVKRLNDMKTQIGKTNKAIARIEKEIPKNNANYQNAQAHNARLFYSTLDCFCDVYAQKNSIQEYLKLDEKKQRAVWVRRLCVVYDVKYCGEIDAKTEEVVAAMEKATLFKKDWVQHFFCDKCQSWRKVRLSLLNNSFDTQNLVCEECREKIDSRVFLNADGTPSLDYIHSQEPCRKYKVSSANAFSADEMLQMHEKMIAEAGTLKVTDDIIDVQAGKYEREVMAKPQDGDKPYSQIGGSFNVFLLNVGARSQEVVVILNDLLSWGWKDIRMLAFETQKPTWIAALSSAKAEALAKKLTAAGATVEMVEI